MEKHNIVQFFLLTFQCMYHGFPYYSFWVPFQYLLFYLEFGKVFF